MCVKYPHRVPEYAPPPHSQSFIPLRTDICDVDALRTTAGLLRYKCVSWSLIYKWFEPQVGVFSPKPALPPRDICLYT